MFQQSHRPSSTRRNLSIRTRIGTGILCLLASFGQVALAADGDPDPTFSDDGIRQIAFAADMNYNDVKVASDAQGNTYIGATYDRSAENGFAVAKIKPDGRIDTTFGNLGYRLVPFVLDVDALHGIFAQPDGSVMLLGKVESSQVDYPTMVRLTAAGDIDTAFGNGGQLVITATPWAGVDLAVRAATRQADGKFLFAGTCSDCPVPSATFLLRTSANGVPDTSFGTNGWATVIMSPTPWFRAVSVDRLGRILLAGQSGSDALVLRMTPSGMLDTSFGSAGSGFVLINNLLNSYASAIEIESGNAIVVALVAPGQNAEPRRTGLVRLLVNGAPDLAYAGTGLRDLSLEFGSLISSLQRRSDGRIIAAGWIDHTIAAGFAGRDFLIARVLRNGALDSSFDGNGLRRIALSNTIDTAEAIVLSAGKPVIAGFSYVGDEMQIGVLRLQSDLIFSDGFE